MKHPATAEEVISLLKLEPHPAEGGWFLETYRSRETLSTFSLPPRYSGTRSFATAIYYLMTPENVSPFHRLHSDEVFHFYLGDPVELALLYPGGRVARRILGRELAEGMRPQEVVPAGVWQGLRLLPGGAYALLGTTVSPGFEFEDFELGDREDLMRNFPNAGSLIKALTRR